MAVDPLQIGISTRWISIGAGPQDITGGDNYGSIDTNGILHAYCMDTAVSPVTIDIDRITTDRYHHELTYR